MIIQLHRSMLKCENQFETGVMSKNFQNVQKSKTIYNNKNLSDQIKFNQKMKTVISQLLQKTILILI